jgi:hypothetical protein
MKLINNTRSVIYYYIPANKIYGLLPFGQQLEVLDSIVSFNNIDEWKNEINRELATDTWFDDNLKNSASELDSKLKYEDNGYLTYYNFRLPVSDYTDHILDELILSNSDPVTLKAWSGDKYSINREDLIKLTNQYKLDKNLYLAMVEK